MKIPELTEDQILRFLDTPSGKRHTVGMLLAAAIDVTLRRVGIPSRLNDVVTLRRVGIPSRLNDVVADRMWKHSARM